MKGFSWLWVVSVVGEGCEDDYELSDSIKSKKRISMLLSASQRRVQNLDSWFYSSNYPMTCLDRPLCLQETEVPGFLDNRNMKVLRLSALRTGRLYPILPEYNPGIHFCERLNAPQSHSATGRTNSTTNRINPSEIEPATSGL